MGTRIKICGVTRAEDAAAAVKYGAHALGLNFFPESPRALSVAQARSIADAVPPFVSVVGVFVDAELEWIRTVAHKVPLDLVQLHGHEEPGFADQMQMPYIKAIRMREDTDLLREARRFRTARGLLVDSFVPGQAGGTGRQFDWSRVPRGIPCPVVLAGGLDPVNVGAAIRQVRPYAVDVTSGVEMAPGRKDTDRIRQFIAAVNEADQDEVARN